MAKKKLANEPAKNSRPETPAGCSNRALIISPADGYDFEKLIGQGAYARVKLATEKATGKKVAVKIYEKSKLVDPQKFKNMKREIEILEEMNHENVIRTFGHFETFRQIHIVTEYAGAQSLADYCKKKPGRKLDEPESRQVLKQALKALVYIHSIGVVHRDVKMDNVMIDSYKKVKLIDFGFSIKLPKNTKINVFCGTPAYMAPEIVSKREHIGEMADIWAFGILFFRLVTGQYPFKATNEKELFQKIKNGKFDFPPGVSVQTKNLILRILKGNPNERPTASQVFLPRSSKLWGCGVFLKADFE
jgi:serine/threonine protein kinase